MTLIQVKIPRNVAESIERQRGIGANNSDIIHAYMEGGAGHDIHDYVSSSDGSFDSLISALVNGYETEKTAEEKVYDIYARRKAKTIFPDEYDRGFNNGFMTGIEATLDITENEIIGVNA